MLLSVSFFICKMGVLIPSSRVSVPMRALTLRSYLANGSLLLSLNILLLNQEIQDSLKKVYFPWLAVKLKHGNAMRLSQAAWFPVGITSWANRLTGSCAATQQVAPGWGETAPFTGASEEQAGYHLSGS